MDHATERAVCSTEFAVLVPREAALFDYLYLVLRSRPFHEYLVARAIGSTGSRQRVSGVDVLNAPIRIPHAQDIAELDELLRPLRDWRRALAHQRRDLDDLTDRISGLVAAGVPGDDGKTSGRRRGSP